MSYCWGTTCCLNSFMHRGIDSAAYSDVGSIYSGLTHKYRISHMCSSDSMFDECEELSIWVTAFSYSSNHLVTLSGLSSWKKRLWHSCWHLTNTHKVCFSGSWCNINAHADARKEPFGFSFNCTAYACFQLVNLVPKHNQIVFHRFHCVQGVPGT